MVAMAIVEQKCKRMLYLRLKDYAEQGYPFAVVLDLSKYFDTLNHEILINLLRKNVKDQRVVQLIKR